MCEFSQTNPDLLRLGGGIAPRLNNTMVVPNREVAAGEAANLVLPKLNGGP